MSRLLETTVSGSQYPSNSQTKFVDGTGKTLGFSWSDVAREVALTKSALGPIARKFFVDSLIERTSVGEIAPTYSGALDVWAAHDAVYVDLDDEKPGVGPAAFAPPSLDNVKKDHTSVIRFLPPEWVPFLVNMKPARRREREIAILEKVGWEGLELVGMCAEAVAEKAEKATKAYAVRFPARNKEGDPINHEPVHRKGRCEKRHRRKLRKLQLRALLYVEAALGAVGGPDTPGRPLYVSDYSLSLHRQQVERTAEILAGLRLIKTADPTVQIPLAELNESAKVADVAKRRLLIDANLMRWAELGWFVCWITVTLPGRYVPHSTNEDQRAEEWDTNLGPAEAAGALQEMHHQTMALIRDKGVRPCGWWNAQPQQSGVGHRHIVLACQTLEDARAVCDQFWKRFSSTPVEERQEERKREDHGCSAYVIGDSDKRYAPPKGKDGKNETATSIAKYAARYSTRYESKADGEHNEGNPKTASDQERFAAWKSVHRVRGHTWMGLDSGRAPMELWDTLWANAQRSDYDPSDARMAIAMRLMREVRSYTEIAVESRKSLEGMEFSEERDAISLTAETAADDAAYAAWHAALALGMWPDADLDLVELEWLRDAVAEWNEANGVDEVDPLPPMPLREMRDTMYGETRKVTIGAVGVTRHFELTATASATAWLEIAENLGVEVDIPESGKIGRRNVFIALKKAGFGFSKRPNGALAGFDLSGEILLRTVDEWEIVDKTTAARRLEESKTPEFREKRRQKEISNLYNLDGTPYYDMVLRSKEVGLSFSPTDPSYSASRSTRVEETPPDAPPN